MTGQDLYCLLVLRSTLDEASVQRIMALIPGIRGKLNRMSRLVMQCEKNNARPQLGFNTTDMKEAAIGYLSILIRLDDLTRLPTSVIRTVSKPIRSKVKVQGTCLPFVN